MSFGSSAMLHLLKRFSGLGGGPLASTVTALQEAAARVKNIHVEGAAGGGLVRVSATGGRVIKSVEIDVSILGKKTVVEDLVRTAVNDALDKAAAAEAKEQEGLMAKLSADLLSQFMGGAARGGGGSSGGQGQLR